MGCCTCPDRPASDLRSGDILIDSPFDLPYPSRVISQRYQPTFTRGGAESSRIVGSPQQQAQSLLPLLALVGIVGYLWYQQRRGR